MIVITHKAVLKRPGAANLASIGEHRTVDSVLLRACQLKSRSLRTPARGPADLTARAARSASICTAPAWRWHRGCRTHATPLVGLVDAAADGVWPAANRGFRSAPLMDCRAAVLPAARADCRPSIWQFSPGSAASSADPKLRQSLLAAERTEEVLCADSAKRKPKLYDGLRRPLATPPAPPSSIRARPRTADASRPSSRFTLESLLPQRLEQDQRHTIGQVQRAGLGIEHGNAQPAVVVFLQKALGQAGGFPAKDEIILRRDS